MKKLLPGLTFTLALVFVLFTYNTQAENGETDVVEVSTIEELRQQDTDGTVYELTAEAILTYQEDWRNSKYIEDGTAGILIDDVGEIITTIYELYDGITGIKGTLSVFGNMLQFVPEEDPGEPTSSGNVIEPLEITLTDFVNNFMDYQARLVTIQDVSFVDPDGNFSGGNTYEITDGVETAEFRATFYDVDYVGDPVPVGSFNITGLPNSRTDGDYITARNWADFEALDFYDVTFDVTDEWNDAINDAEITLLGETNAAGDYFFEDIPAGTHTYTAEKEGFYLKTGQVTVADEDVTHHVVMVEISDDLVNAFPWTADLEGMEFPPATWNNYSYGEGNWNYTDDTYTEDQALLHEDDPAGVSDSWLVSPQIEIGEDENLLLTFYQKNAFMGQYDEDALHGVMISTGSGNPEHGDFHLVYESDASIENYTERLVSLGDYEGQVIYVAFVYQGDEGWHSWFVDNIIIEEAPEAILVDNIAQLRDQEISDDIIYQITGEVVITHQQIAYRGQMYIQDDTGAIMIDDDEGIIETEFDNYDGITNLKGNLTEFQDMLQFAPTEDPGAASSTGNTVDPQEVTLEDLAEEHQAMLVVVRNVSFDFDHEDFPDDHTFTHNESFYIIDETGEGVIRTPNSPDLLDYFGTEIPTTPKDLVGVIHQRYDAQRLLPRSLADFLEPTSVQDIAEAGFTMYPNPANNEFNVSGEEMIDFVRIFNINGQLMMEQAVQSEQVRINTSFLQTGIYIVQVVAGENTLNQKLQIQK